MQSWGGRWYFKQATLSDTHDSAESADVRRRVGTLMIAVGPEKAKLNFGKRLLAPRNESLRATLRHAALRPDG